MSSSADNNGVGGLDYVKFGDTVSFFDNQKKGYVYSELSTEDGPYNGVFVHMQNSPTDPGIRDFQSCVFEIVAPEKYKQGKALASKVKSAQNKYRRLHRINQESKSPAGMFDIHGELSVDDALDRVKSRSLKELAVAEARDNELEQRRRHGMNVTYGQVVQLWHPFSRRFLQVSGSNNSVTEPSNMKIELSAGASRECYFRIMPRYKVRSVGDLIAVNDEIVLESEKSRGQFIHCSADALHSGLAKVASPLAFLHGNYEVNLSVSKASFLIHAFNSAGEFSRRRYGSALELYTNPISNELDEEESEAGSIAVRAGTVVQLFHKDSDGYLSAEGLFGAELKQDIHLRVRHPDPERPSRSLPPTSSVTYFMIEKSIPTKGGVVVWEEMIRFKHVTSQKYLTLREVRDDEKADGSISHFATLTDDIDDRNTIFRMHPLIRESDHVPVDAYTRIENVETNEWLHIATDMQRRPPRAEKEDGENDGLSYTERMKKIEWDGAELLEVAMVKDHFFDDAFSLAMVPTDYVFFGNFIAGVIPMLRQYIRIRAERPLTGHEANVLASVLHQLNSFLFVKGIEQKKRQKRLRDFKVIELLIEMLHAPFSINASRSNDEDVKLLLTNTSPSAIHDYDDITKQENERTYMVMNGVFEVLESFLTGDSRKNEVYMGQHIPFLWELFGTNMAVEPMFNEMIRDNISLIMEIQEPEILKVINMLEKDKNADYLEYLSVLCVCENAPYRANQTTIGRLLLDRKTPPVFLTEVMDRDDKGRVNIKVSQNGTWNDTTTLAKFAASALDEDDTTSTPEYLFLQRQLELYGNLCLGRHETNIDFITVVHHHLTWEECFICARSNWNHQNKQEVDVKFQTPGKDGKMKDEIKPCKLPKLPQSLRRIYVDLMVRLFIDVGDNRDIVSEVELAFDWETLTLSYFELASEDDTVALSGAKFEHFPRVLIWINDFLTAIDGHMIHSHPTRGKPKNMLICSVLELLKKLIRFGYYSDEENIKILVVPLSDLIDGMNDFDEIQDDDNDGGGVNFSDQPKGRGRLQTNKSMMSRYGEDDEDKAAKLAVWRKSGRYEMDDNCRTVVAAKFQALDCIESLYKLIFNIKLRTMLCDFKMFCTIPGPGQHAREKALKIPNRKDGGPDWKRWHELQEFADVMKMVLDTATSGRDLSSLISNADLTQKVRAYVDNLAAHVNWITPGWMTSMGFRHHAKTGLFGAKEEIKPTLIEVLLDLAKYKDDDLLAKSVGMVESIYSANQDLFTLAIQAVAVLTDESKALTKQLRMDVPKLAQLTGTVISADLIPVVTNMLHEYTAKCFRVDGQTLYEEYKDMRPHDINQNIIYNSGLVTIVLDIIEIDYQDGATLEACFRFLRAICREFPVIQNQLALDLDKILTTVGGAGDGDSDETWENVMAHTVTEIFNGCKETCLRITEAQVEELLELLAHHTVDAPAFLNALEAVAKVEEWNLPLKRNQQIIIKSLWSSRDKVIDVAYIDDESSAEINAKRLALLKDGSSDKQLQEYHLNLVNLLGSTCEGENRQIEAMCRSIFSLEELLETIAQIDIPHRNKAPYIKFLLWVYLNTASSTIEAGTGELNQDVTLFSALDIICKAEIGNYFATDGNWVMPVGSESFCEQFAFDIMVPCLENLVDDHFPNSENENYDELMGHLVSILNSMTRMYLNALKSTSTSLSKYRLFDMTSFFATVKKRMPTNSPILNMSTNEGKLFQSAYEGVSQRAMAADAQIASGTEEAFINKYRDELNINTKFNVFVEKLRTAYRGENTVRDQLFHLHKLKAKIDDELLDEEYTPDEGEDDAVRLGPEFQQLIEVFYDSTHDHFLIPHLEILVRLWRNGNDSSHSTQQRIQAQRVNTKTLLVVRGAIHNKEVLELSTAALQGEVSSSGAILPITRLLESKQHEVRREALSLLKVLLKDGLADAQREFVRHFLGTREETFFADISGLINASSESMLELRTLRQQKEESDRAGSKLRETMRTTLGNTMGKVMQSVFNKGTATQTPPGSVVNPASGEFVPMTSGLAVGAQQQQVIAQPVEDDFFSKMKDEGNITLVLSVLQGMCEGHNTVLQNYLRVQPDNIASTDLVSMCTNFLEIATIDINEYKELLVQLLNTLTEFAQGNVQNQRAIFSNSAADYINAIIRTPIDKSDGKRLGEEEEMQMAELHMSCADLLLSMLATNDSNTAYLARELDKILDTTSLLRLMRHYTDPTWSKEFHPDGVDWEDIELEPEDVGFGFYNVLARLRDFSKKNYHEQIAILRPDKAWRDEPEHHYELNFIQSYNMLEKNTATIEVMDAGEVQKIHFWVHPEWRQQLRREAKDAVINNIDRTSPTDQVRDFVDKCRNIIADMKYLEVVINKSWITRALLIYDSQINNIFYYLTLLINLLMLLSWTAPVGSLRDPVPAFRTDFGGEALFHIIGYLHLAATIVMVAAHFLQHPPSYPEGGIFGSKSSREEEEHEEELDAIEGEGEVPLDDTALEALKSGGDAKGVVARLADESLVDRATYRTRESIFSGSSLAHILFLVSSLLGVLAYGYTFGLCLLHIVKGNSYLNGVIEAVRRPATSLLYVAALMGIFIYIYTLIAFMLYRENFDNDDGAYCQDLFQCFITSLRLGLMSGGGFGEALPFDPFGFYEVNTGPLSRMFFDLSFFALVTIIMLNVVFGIIVDTFSELRDEKSKNDEAMKSECFICSQKASDFERFGNGFTEHVKHEHHMWNYLFFFYHLDQKDPSEFTALEQMVAEKLLKNDYSFFPINRSLNMQLTEGDDMAEQIEEIHNTLLSRLERSEAREAKLQSQVAQLVAQTQAILQLQQQQPQQPMGTTRTRSGTAITTAGSFETNSDSDFEA